MSLPPYLISSASSRAHHALLVKLDAAESVQAADVAVLAEVERCRGVLDKKPSPSKVADTLIILLTCASAATVPLDLDFALMPALQTAEGGRSTRDRRTAYMYLCEQLPPEHELHLMLVNTVRKDLASAEDAHVLMALHAVCHLPGPDLAPAVVPLLTERRLLEHHLPAVRQRTLQALSMLGAPLPLRDLARRIRHEDNPSVLASVLTAFASALDSGAREELPEKRRRQFDSVFAAAARNLDPPSPLLLAIIRALLAIVHTLPRFSSAGDLDSHVLQRTRALLEETVAVSTTRQPWSQACLLEACRLITGLHAVDGGVDGTEELLAHLRRLLLGPKGKERAARSSRSSSAASSPRKAAASLATSEESPNTRIFVMRCFASLPSEVWQRGLEEAHMGALMAGVDSADSTTRRETLRLLARADRNLPTLTLQSHLDSIAGQGYPPASVSPMASRAEVVAAGRNEAAARAYEAVEVGSEGGDERARGTALAEGLARVTAARAEHESGVWLQGVHMALGDLEAGSASLRTAFIESTAKALCAAPDDSTLAVLLATAAVEYDIPSENGTTASSRVVPALLAALPGADASVQELIILALVPLRATDASSTLEKVAEGAIPHIARRCEQVGLVLRRRLGEDVVARAKSRALNDILDAVLAVYAEATRPPPADDRDDFDTPTASMLRGSKALRYNYEPTSSGGKTRSPLQRAGELAMGRSMLQPAGDDVQLDNLERDTGRLRL